MGQKQLRRKYEKAAEGVYLLSGAGKILEERALEGVRI